LHRDRDKSWATADSIFTWGSRIAPSFVPAAARPHC